MDLAKVLNELNTASLFELYRLRVAINQELDNPKRLAAVKRRIHTGQRITYFDGVENRLIDATVISIKRTRLLVENIHDQKRWNLPLYYVNIDEVDADIPVSSEQSGIPKNQLKVGDRVGFYDRDNNERYGEVIRLNPKTASVRVGSHAKWRVSYILLFPVIDGEHEASENLLLIEGEVLERDEP